MIDKEEAISALKESIVKLEKELTERRRENEWLLNNYKEGATLLIKEIKARIY